MKGNSKFLFIFSLALAATLSVAVLSGCGSASTLEDQKDTRSTLVNSENPSGTPDSGASSSATPDNSAVTDDGSVSGTSDGSGMKVAYSQEGVFTVRIPESWGISVADSSMLMAYSENSGFVLSFNVAENQEYASSAEVAQANRTVYQQMYGMEIEEPVATTLDGSDASKFFVTDEEGFVTTMVFCLKDGQVYTFSFVSTSSAASAGNQFDQILGSFTFS